jgi:WD40 repeat protein
MHPDSGADEGMILTLGCPNGNANAAIDSADAWISLWTVAWSPVQPLFACGTTGHELFVWDMIKGIPLVQLEGHTDMIDRLAWSPDGHHLASIARDGTLQVWDLFPVCKGTVMPYQPPRPVNGLSLQRISFRKELNLC